MAKIKFLSNIVSFLSIALLLFNLIKRNTSDKLLVIGVEWCIGFVCLCAPLLRYLKLFYTFATPNPLPYYTLKYIDKLFTINTIYSNGKNQISSRFEEKKR